MHLVSDTDSNMVLKRPLANGRLRTSHSLLIGGGKCVAITFLSKTQAKFIFEVQHATTWLHNYGYNEASDIKTRIQQAKRWLQQHDNETITTAARIFKV